MSAFEIRDGIVVYRIYKIPRKITEKQLIEKYVNKIMDMGVTPWAIQRVGDFVEVALMRPTEEDLKKMEKCFATVCGIKTHWMKDDDPVLRVNIAGSRFQEQIQDIAELIRDRGTIVNFYRQVKKHRGELIENGVITFWMTHLTGEIQREVDGRRRIFFNQDVHDEMLKVADGNSPVDPPASNVAPSGASTNDGEDPPPVGKSAEAAAPGGDHETREPTGGEPKKQKEEMEKKQAPVVEKMSIEAESEAAVAVEKPKQAEMPPQLVNPVSLFSDAASMDVDDPRMTKRKIEEIEKETDEEQSEEESSDEEESPEETEEEKKERQEDAPNTLEGWAEKVLNKEENEDWVRKTDEKRDVIQSKEEFVAYGRELMFGMVDKRNLAEKKERGKIKEERERRTKEKIDKAKETLKKSRMYEGTHTT